MPMATYLLINKFRQRYWQQRDESGLAWDGMGCDCHCGLMEGRQTALAAVALRDGVLVVTRHRGRRYSSTALSHPCVMILGQMTGSIWSATELPLPVSSPRLLIIGA